MMSKRGLFLIVFMAVSGIVQAGSLNAEDLFSEVRKKLNGIKDYTADVRMVIDVSYMKVPPLGGKLYYKSPDKLKLERKGGITILPKKGINMSLNTSIPEGEATIIDGGYATVDGRELRVLKVVPDNDKQGIILTKMWIDEDRKLVLQTETTTRDNGTIVMELEFDKYAQYALPDKVVFRLDVKGYKLPQGITMDYDAGSDLKMAEGDENKKTKGKIKITYLNYKINTGLSDDIFELEN